MDDTPYILGRFIGGFVVFPLIIFGIGYGLLRLTKKRKPTKKEMIILVSVAVLLTLFAMIGAAGRRSSGL